MVSFLHHSIVLKSLISLKMLSCHRNWIWNGPLQLHGPTRIDSPQAIHAPKGVVLKWTSHIGVKSGWFPGFSQLPAIQSYNNRFELNHGHKDTIDRKITSSHRIRNPIAFILFLDFSDRSANNSSGPVEIKGHPHTIAVAYLDCFLWILIHWKIVSETLFG